MISVEDAKSLLKELGMPKAQLNKRSALTLLALLGLTPDSSWKNSEQKLLGVTPIMDFISLNWEVLYAPNSRETFRRHTLHHFCDGGICAYNPDEPSRPVNSPKACYQVVEETFKLIKFFGSLNWDEELNKWKSSTKTLVEKYSRERNMKKVPITIGDGKEFILSPGIHSELIASIVEEFSPRFAEGAKLIYIGDTGAKADFYDDESFESINLLLDKKGKLPDVVLIHKEKRWIFLIESVTSHGPVDEKRYLELNNLFDKTGFGLIFVSAFPDKKTLNKFFSEIAWETEVWLSDSPEHLIHLNGDRFFGPRKKEKS